MYDFWSILGIEPTTNKKVIQQAYADKLKIYHPEDDPVGFQNLRDAYRSAIAYAKNQSVSGRTVQIPERVFTGNTLQKRPIEEHADTTKIVAEEKTAKKKEYIEENEPDFGGDNKESEAIPEYIAQMRNADVSSLYNEDIQKYVLRLRQYLICPNGRASFKPIEELFEDIQFRLIINLDEFFSAFEDEMSYFAYWNQTALSFLLTKVEQTMRENTSHNLARFKRYLESKKDNTHEGQTSFWLVVLGVFIFFVIGFFMVKLDSTDSSPNAEEVCQIVEERYGIELEEEDIKISHVTNYDTKTSKNNPKVVRYDIVYEDGEETYSFSGIYLPKGKVGPEFDLEKEILANYIEEYLQCDYFPNWNVMFMEAFRIKTQIASEEDKEAFVEQFTIMMDDLFHDPMMANSDYRFVFDISVEGALESLQISMDKEDYIEVCDMLSEELEYILQNVLLEKAFEEGKYSMEEYWEKKTELQMQKME